MSSSSASNFYPPSPGAMPTLLTLPLEILTQTLANLNHTSLITCKLTCKHLNNLVCASAELQYILAKAHASVDDSSSASSSLSTAEKLALLKERKRAWLNVDFSFREKLEIPVPTSGLYDVTPHAYFVGCAVGGNKRITDALMYARLPSRKGEVVCWDKLDVGRMIVDFGTSVEEHDLIALVVYRNENSTQWLDIVLRRFSNGLEHPHAEKHTIPVCKALPELGPLSLSIEIAGENLVLCVDYLHTGGIGGVMFVFDWMRGVLKFKPTPISNNALVFLTHTIFLQPDVNQLTLDAYYLPPSSSPLCSPNTLLHPFKSLRLPQLKRGMNMMSISCRGDPSPRDPASVRPPPGVQGVTGLTRLAPSSSDNSSSFLTTSSSEPDPTPDPTPTPTPFKHFTSTPHDALILFTLDLRAHFGEGRVEFLSYPLLIPRHRILRVVEGALEGYLDVLESELRRGKEEEDEVEDENEEEEESEEPTPSTSAARTHPTQRDTHRFVRAHARSRLKRMSWWSILEERERILARAARAGGGGGLGDVFGHLGYLDWDDEGEGEGSDADGDGEDEEGEGEGADGEGESGEGESGEGESGEGESGEGESGEGESGESKSGEGESGEGESGEGESGEGESGEGESGEGESGEGESGEEGEEDEEGVDGEEGTGGVMPGGWNDYEADDLMQEDELAEAGSAGSDEQDEYDSEYDEQDLLWDALQTTFETLHEREITSLTASASASYLPSSSPPYKIKTFYTPYDKLHYVASYPGSGKVCPLEWSEWGPENSRLFDFGNDGEVDVSEFITVSSGARYVRLCGGEGGEGGGRGGKKRKIEIMDFSHPRVLSSLSLARSLGSEFDCIREENGKGTWLVVTESCPTIIDGKKSAFVGAVETTLSYVSTVSEEGFEYESVLVDEERVVGLLYPDEGTDAAEWKKSVFHPFEVLYFG